MTKLPMNTLPFTQMVRRRITVAPLAMIALATPSIAAAPQFQTSAPIAYMEDLSSGAVLFARDADRRMPPASMAKMMTVYVAFDMLKKGELKLDHMVTVRPETWAKWHGPSAGSTMFLSANESVSVANLLYGIVTLSATTPASFLRNRSRARSPPSPSA